MIRITRVFVTAFLALAIFSSALWFLARGNAYEGRVVALDGETFVALYKTGPGKEKVIKGTAAGVAVGDKTIVHLGLFGDYVEINGKRFPLP